MSKRSSLAIKVKTRRSSASEKNRVTSPHVADTPLLLGFHLKLQLDPLSANVERSSHSFSKFFPFGIRESEVLVGAKRGIVAPRSNREA